MDLSEFATAFGKTFTIPLPNDVHNLSGETEAEVEVTLKGLETKRIIATNIELNNISEGYSADTITQYKEVLIRGTEESLEDINADDVVIVVDLAGIGQAVGRYSLPGKVYVDSEENVGAVGGNYTVVVEITKDE